MKHFDMAQSHVGPPIEPGYRQGMLLRDRSGSHYGVINMGYRQHEYGYWFNARVVAKVEPAVGLETWSST